MTDVRRIAEAHLLAALWLVLPPGCGGGDGQEADAGPDADGAPDAAEPAASISVIPPEHGTTELAEEAVALAPSWLAADLRAAFIVLDPAEQDTLAELVVSPPEARLRDEIAFTVAHLAPEHVARPDFYPELVTENAASLYAVDPFLDYADIVDYGDPAAGGDYHSTVRYRTVRDGEVAEVELPRDIFYWYVVHPVVEDEAPTYVSPASGRAADPPVGVFWRDYLFFHSDPGYDPLVDYLEGIDVSFGGLAYEREDNGAIGRIIQYVLDVLDFDSGAERPIQPVRVYSLHCGRCGEHQDLTTAAARSALIPCINVSAWANDHVWNEFWDGRWIQWEPVNTYVEHYYYYADEAGNYHRSGIGIDNDCDGEVDEGSELRDPLADGDEDGVTRGDGDCDDTRESVYPGAPELADGIDNDCDGVADDGSDLVDGDGDGLSIADGDCDDGDEAIYPGAVEVADNGRDDDCDGVADDGSSTVDADEDGSTIADGDCDDTRAEVYPDAPEVPDGVDNDCDGIADDGSASVDADGDGFSIEEGDCNDRGARINPDAAEEVPSSNRCFAVSATRGDGRVWTVTERYAGVFTLEVDVEDEGGLPVDGATVIVAGFSTTYPDSPGIFIATWAVTDMEGHAVFELGEANEYYLRVESPLGNIPVEDNRVTLLFDDPVRGEVRQHTVVVDGVVPQLELGDLEVADPEEVAWSLEVELDFTEGFHRGRSFFTELTSREPSEGLVDVAVVDDDGLAALDAGEPASALDSFSAVGEEALSVDLPDGRPWHVVVTPSPSVSAIVHGTVRVAALYLGEEVSSVEESLALLHSERIAVRVEVEE